jgi:hypothetical protein
VLRLILKCFVCYDTQHVVCYYTQCVVCYLNVFCMLLYTSVVCYYTVSSSGDTPIVISSDAQRILQATLAQQPAQTAHPDNITCVVHRGGQRGHSA